MSCELGAKELGKNLYYRNFNLNCLSNLAEQISSMVEANSRQGHNTIVSICGGSCTGKSTQVAVGLKHELGGPVQVLSQDHFMIASVANTLNPVYGWDHPDSFCLHESAGIMDQLRKNIPCSMPQYSFDTLALEGIKEITPSRIALFEGLYAGYDFLRDHTDLVIYVEMPLYARIIRRLLRNMHERYTNIDPKLILESYLRAPLKAHHDFVVHQKCKADVVVEVRYNFQQGIEKFNLKPALKNVNAEEVVFEFLIDDRTSFVISNDGAGYYFNILHDTLIYFCFPIEKITYEKFLFLDMLSL